MKDDEPFALAGIYLLWRSPDGKTVMETFALITTEPNELLQEKTGHDRMPVIIKKQDYQRSSSLPGIARVSSRYLPA